MQVPPYLARGPSATEAEPERRIFKRRNIRQCQGRVSIFRSPISALFWDIPVPVIAGNAFSGRSSWRPLSGTGAAITKLDHRLVAPLILARRIRHKANSVEPGLRNLPAMLLRLFLCEGVPLWPCRRLFVRIGVGRKSCEP